MSRGRVEGVMPERQWEPHCDLIDHWTTWAFILSERGKYGRVLSKRVE